VARVLSDLPNDLLKIDIGAPVVRLEIAVRAAAFAAPDHVIKSQPSNVALSANEYVTSV
jgi:hypothetical protein